MKSIAFKEIKGKVFNRLEVVADAGIIRGHRHFICKCKCGNIVTVETHHLRSGHTNSCGCYAKERTSQASIKHGQTCNRKPTPEYKSWTCIKERCNNPYNQDYKNYGGRGIKCLWNSFDEFYKDMGKRPSKRHSVGRIDNDGHYHKNNCRWETYKEQANNKRTSRWLTYNGETCTMKQMSEKYNIKYKTLFTRLSRDKKTTQEALCMPV